MAFKTKKQINKQEARNEIATENETECCYLMMDKLPTLLLCLLIIQSAKASKTVSGNELGAIDDIPVVWKHFCLSPITMTRSSDLTEMCCYWFHFFANESMNIPFYEIL